ncbi:putative ADP-ribosylation factor GTPase-activating protein AGD5 [Platanthera guangdongensis]|uniref:ADP-ribosylation factor GTPase-activating protein AGD5 n=1 Tax=Platanthera guangdongensis TaxID=2320717 RepID=A0ABR2MY58_9ASPA
MGNEKSNSYWEAELPSNYDRVGIENFIRAKYNDKRWIPRNEISESSKVLEERTYEPKLMPVDRVVPRSRNSSGSMEEVNKVPVQSVKMNIAAASKTSAQESRQVSTESNAEPVLPKADTPQAVETALRGVDIASTHVKAQPVPPAEPTLPPKVDYATDLFNLLSMDSSITNESDSSPTEDNSWAGFQFEYGFSLRNPSAAACLHFSTTSSYSHGRSSIRCFFSNHSIEQFHSTRHYSKLANSRSHRSRNSSAS